MIGMINRGSGGSGTVDPEEDDTTTFDTSTQTLGTTGLGTSTGSDDSGSSTSSSSDDTIDVEVTTSDPDPNASSPAGGVGAENAAEAFSGQEDVDDPIATAQETSDQFTQMMRDAREAGLDVDVTEAIGGFDGDGVLQNGREAILNAVQQARNQAPDLSGILPSGLSPVAVAGVAGAGLLAIVAGGGD